MVYVHQTSLPNNHSAYMTPHHRIFLRYIHIAAYNVHVCCEVIEDPARVRTCMTQENQQVLPTFLRPTGQLATRLRSCGLSGSTNQMSARFRFVPDVVVDLLSRRLCSSTLKPQQQQHRMPVWHCKMHRMPV